MQLGSSGAAVTVALLVGLDAEALDETEQGFDFFHETFDYRYP